MTQPQMQTTMAPGTKQEIVSIPVVKSKAAYLQQLAVMSEESLAILAEKSRKPGIEQRLKTFKNLI